MFRKPFDEAKFSHLISAIYDCVLEPMRWRAALAGLASALQSAGSSVIINDSCDAKRTLLFEHGVDQKYLRLFFQRHAAEDQRNAYRQRRETGVPTTLAALCSEQPEARAFFDSYVLSQGLGDSIAVQLLRSGRRIGWLSTARSGIQPAYERWEREVMKALSPHLCQAVALSDALDLATVKANTLEQTVDALSAGVFFTDAAGCVVHMNRSARRLIEQGDGLRLIRKQLVTTDRSAAASLARALAARDCTDAALGSGGTILALSDGTGTGYLASVLPLDRGIRRNLMAPFRAKAGVFVQDPLAAARVPAEALSEIYELTRAELKVLIAIAPGLSAKQAARVLGLREPTVKTHLQRIFLKTGMGGQSELVRLLLAHSPPLRPS